MKPADASVSVVITTYNHARFLEDAIASVEAQTTPVDEIIVVDDGSSDDPAAVVGRHPCIRLIRQANQGLAAARNTGLRAATGRFVAFLDADDRLLPTMVETNLSQFAERPDCAFVYGAYLNLDETSGRTTRVPLRPPGPDPYASFLASNLVGMHGTVLYRRDQLEAEGGFDPTLRVLEDYDLYLRLARKHPVAAHDTPLAEYRRHRSNISNDVPFMLATTLRVHRRHEKVARTRPDWENAYRLGVVGWQNYFVRVQLGQVAKAVRNRTGVLHGIERTMRLVPLAPRALLRQLRSQVRRLFASRLRQGRAGLLPFRRVRFGDLRRTAPFSTVFGFDRGKPVDRRYVETFLTEHAGDVRGRVLEIGDSTYTRRFGGDRVERADVLNRYPGHPETTFVGDLCDGAGLPDEAFDCIVLTQTLHLIFDMPTAVRTLWRILRPGGVLLLTVPWISAIDRGEWSAEWCWSVAPRALDRLLREAFVGGEVHVTSYGNVFAATAFIYGLAEQELEAADLDAHDPQCPVVVAGRAVKAVAQA